MRGVHMTPITTQGHFYIKLKTSHFCITLWEYFIKISQALGIREYVVKLAEVKNANW